MYGGFKVRTSVTDGVVQSFEVDGDGVRHCGVVTTRAVWKPAWGGYWYDAQEASHLSGPGLTGDWTSTVIASAYDLYPPDGLYAEHQCCVISAHDGVHSMFDTFLSGSSDYRILTLDSTDLYNSTVDTSVRNGPYDAFIRSFGYGLAWHYGMIRRSGSEETGWILTDYSYDQSGLIATGDKLQNGWNCYGPGGYSAMYSFGNDEEYLGYTTTTFGSLPWTASDVCYATCIKDGDGAVHVAASLGSYDYNGTSIVYGKLAGGVWTTKTLMDSGGTWGRVQVLLRPDTQKPIVTWVDWGGDDNIWVADPTPEHDTLAKGPEWGKLFADMIDEDTVGFMSPNGWYGEFHIGNPRQYWSMA